MQREVKALYAQVLCAFIKERVEECPNGELDKEELYGALIHYCNKKNFAIPAKDFVSRNLQTFLPDARSGYCRVQGQIKRAWMNIRLKKQ